MPAGDRVRRWVVYSMFSGPRRLTPYFSPASSCFPTRKRWFRRKLILHPSLPLVCVHDKPLNAHSPPPRTRRQLLLPPRLIQTHCYIPLSPPSIFPHSYIRPSADRKVKINDPLAFCSFATNARARGRQKRKRRTWCNFVEARILRLSLSLRALARTDIFGM